MRNLKVLGLVLVAVLAMSAMVAATASADKFTAEKYPVTITGDQDGGTNTVNTTAGTISCKVISYIGTVSAATTEASAAPSFSECTALGLPMIVHVNGCVFKFTQTTAGAAATTSRVDIVCPVGNEITVTVGPNAEGSGTVRCTIHIPPQNGLAHVNWTNIGFTTTRELTGHISIASITYSHTKGSGLGACTTGEATDGTYTGLARVTGENPTTKEHIGIFLS